MTPEEARVVEVDGHRLDYQVRRSTKRRTMAIAVEPDQRVIVTAPTSVSDERIVSAVRRRAGWIRRQQRAFEALPPVPAPRRWVAGETHRYLGRQYRLKLMQGNRASVRLLGPFFIISVPRLDDRRIVQRAMENWYKDHARALLATRVTTALASTTWLDLAEPPSLTLRAMKQRWGSTTRRGRVYFNLDLVKLPLGCIDYVVMHELVHLKIPHHGPAFWRLLSRCMPDWEKWRTRLANQEV